MKGNHKHGHAAGGVSPTYRSWRSMRDRCCNPKSIGYKDYGARGTKVCERWMVFANFLEDMGERPKGMTIDRKENSKGYEPGNCRWATTKEQGNNQTSNRRVELYGVSLTLSEWEGVYEISRGLLHARLKLGWSVERAITTPVNHNKGPRRPVAAIA